MKQKQYSWNRNTAHHRIAITRFSVFAFIQSVFVGLLVTLSMGISSDGTRVYIVTTAIVGLIGMVVTFASFVVIMTVMYQWVCDNDASPPPPPQKEPPDVFYQDENGGFWKAPKSGGGGSVNRG